MLLLSPCTTCFYYCSFPCSSWFSCGNYFSSSHSCSSYYCCSFILFIFIIISLVSVVFLLHVVILSRFEALCSLTQMFVPCVLFVLFFIGILFNLFYSIANSSPSAHSIASFIILASGRCQLFWLFTAKAYCHTSGPH